MKNPVMIKCESSLSSRLTFLFIWCERNDGLKTVEISLNFYQGTINKQHIQLSTVQLSHSLFDLHVVITEILARIKITMQSLAAAGY